MLHAKFRGNRTIGSGGEIFEGLFSYGHVTQMPRINIRSPYPRRLHKKIGFDWPSGLEEDVRAL